MGIVQIQLVDLFTRSVIKKMTLRSKPKRPYNPHGRHESYNVQTQNSESEADLRCGGHQCLLCGTERPLFSDKGMATFLSWPTL